jgi:serine/threonine protein kinase
MAMDDAERRWHGQRSSYTWEQDALDHIRAQMPDTEPYRAWQTFKFTADRGHVREVDLFIATPGGLFLVEIKSHPGTARNNGSTWVFHDAGRIRTIENPLHFTDHKAKELRTQLERAAGRGVTIPRIEAAVFLSAENLRCEFDQFQRERVYGRDGRKDQTSLDGIWQGFLNRPPRSERNRVTPALSRQLPDLLRRIGIARLHKAGKVGPYELDKKSFDAGPTWEDYLAANTSLAGDQPRRVRVYLSEQNASEEDKKSTQRAARREYLALQGIAHEGIVRAEQYSDELLAGPAVVFRHGADWQRLDHFMVTSGDLELETRLEMIRQLAEALDHAHRRHLYHRALAPRSVYVELDGRYPRLRIADWQVAARPQGTSTGSLTSFHPGALLKHVEPSAAPYLAPEFTAPEAPAVLLDVFGLGALSYLILTGIAPASSREQAIQKLTAERALAPSAVADSVTHTMDALVRQATALSPAERTGTVRDFLRALEMIEREIAEPATEPDPLTAAPRETIAGWTVVRVLGKGSTSKAYLVEKPNEKARVFKVALNDAAAHRLEREAKQLAELTDSHVARLLDAPFQAGPPGRRRMVIGVEYVGDHTLAEELRQRGPLAMTIQELERLGDDLFQALRFLDGRGVWHRDIKPENLALRKLDPRKGRELVLFDFSLAGVPDTELSVGTKDYLDPFLGTGRRDRYDQAAELYAVAVTLHEMVSGELPSWGDDLVPAGYLDLDEEVQLAEDVFDPVIRDGLVAFFKKALHRDAAQRYGSLRAMTRAWDDIFRDVETQPPFTTAATQDDEDETGSADTVDEESRRAALQDKRDVAALAATPDTPLIAAGLTPVALSVALRHLSVSTAGELARVSARRLTSLKGIGRDPRYELVRRSRDWRQRFQLSETELSRQDPGPAEDQEQQVKTGHSERPRVSPPPEDRAHLSLDEVARRLVPGVPELLQVTGLAATRSGHQVAPWASRQEASEATGLLVAQVAAHLDRLHARWSKSGREFGLAELREDVIAILREHGRVMSAAQLATSLLSRRGSTLTDDDARLRVALLCVRAAVETEERRAEPHLVSRRKTSKSKVSKTGRASVVLAALTETVGPLPAPRADDLFAYAELLGEQADALAARDTLPSVTEVRQVLRDVVTADHATRLSDTDLVLLAAAASDHAAANGRLELYPRDLAPERALKISQLGSLLGRATDAELLARLLARFPDLAHPPRVTDMSKLVRAAWPDAERGTDGLLRLHASTLLSVSRGRDAGTVMAARLADEALAETRQRLTDARRLGGFVAVRVSVADAAAACDELAALDGVVPVDVTATFVRLLDEARDNDRPRWAAVLAADSPAASPAARNGFAGLVTRVWEGLDAHIRTMGQGNGGRGSIVLLHDATPLARYGGGLDLLVKLAVAARDATESPRGLWLLCPMANPTAPPRLDGTTVPVIPGDVEQLTLPEGFGRSQDLEGTTEQQRGKAS